MTSDAPALDLVGGESVDDLGVLAQTSWGDRPPRAGLFAPEGAPGMRRPSPHEESVSPGRARRGDDRPARGVRRLGVRRAARRHRVTLTGTGGTMMGGSGLDEAGYLAEMIPHHQEAVAAATQLARPPRPEMQALGRRITETQNSEIRQMTGWPAGWYPQQPRPGYRPMMRDLSALSGDDLDRAFLTDMVPHHMSAVMMSRRLLVSGAPSTPRSACSPAPSATPSGTRSS